MIETTTDRNASSGNDASIMKGMKLSTKVLLDDTCAFQKRQTETAYKNKLVDILPTASIGSDGGFTFKSLQNPDLIATDPLAFVPRDGDPSTGTVTRDARGNVTQVVYSNGKSRDFQYDDTGVLNSIKQPDGNVYRLQDGKWILQSQNNDVQSPEQNSVSVSRNQSGTNANASKGSLLDPQISADGKFTYSTLDGQHVSVTPDGVQVVQRGPDQSLITSDVNDRVTKTSYGDGRSQLFEYGSKGTLLKFSDANGTTYSLKGDKYVDASGQDSGLTNIVVSATGEVSFDRNGKQTVIHTDFSTATTNENNSVTTKDSQGVCTSVAYSNNQKRNFAFDSTGVLSGFTDPDGQNYVLKNGKWLNDDGSDSGFSQVNVDENGGLTYIDKDRHVVSAATDGTISTTTKTIDELQATSTIIRGAELNHKSDAVLQSLAGLTDADLLVLQQDYVKSFQSTLIEDLKSNLWDDNGAKISRRILECDLAEDAKKYLSDKSSSDGISERQKFLDNLQTFAQRSAKEGFTDAQIAAVYGSVYQLFESTGGKISQQWRHNVAAEIMDQAANPDNADQGYHGTCQMTSVEGRTWWRHPEIAAGMISQIALEGHWTSYDGKIITIPDGGLVPDGEARTYPKIDNYRSFASQIFQVGVFNDWGQRDNPPRWYTLQHPEGDGAADDGWLDSLDGRELLRDKDGNVSKPGFGFAEIGFYNQLLGGSDGNTTLLNAQYGYADCSTVGTFKSADELAQLIEENQRVGNMPVAIGVAASDCTVFGGDQNRSDPGHQVDHVVLIDDYDAQTGMVKLNNSWGPDGDKWVKLDDFYYATGHFDEPVRIGGAL